MPPVECPSCKSDLRQTWEGIDGTPREGSRVIGRYDRDRDRTTEWQCPDCNHVWARSFTQPDYAGAGDIKCCRNCGSRNCFCHTLP